MIFTCNDFQGHWPVGTAAVVVAEDALQASVFLAEELEQYGLKQEIKSTQMIPMIGNKVVILCDGNY